MVMRNMLLVILLLLASSLHCATLEKSLKDLKANLEHLLNQLQAKLPEGPPPPIAGITYTKGSFRVRGEGISPEEAKKLTRDELNAFVAKHDKFFKTPPRSFKDLTVLQDEFNKLESSLKQTNPHDVIEVYARLLEALGIEPQRGRNYLALVRKYFQLMYLKGRSDTGEFDVNKLSKIERDDWNRLWGVINIKAGQYERWLYEATTGTPQFQEPAAPDAPPAPEAPAPGVKKPGGPAEEELLAEILLKHAAERKTAEELEAEVAAAKAQREAKGPVRKLTEKEKLAEALRKVMEERSKVIHGDDDENGDDDESGDGE